MSANDDSKLPIVVIVEDDAELADVYARWLADSYRVRSGQTAEAAKDIIDSEVDVVLLDRKLPGTSGDVVLDWIRKRGYQARVAMITAVSPDFDVIEMGFDAYVEKPLSRDELRDVVQMLLTRTIFDQRIQRYLELANKKKVVEKERDTADLDKNEDYQRLKRKLTELRAEIDFLIRDLDEDYFASEIEAVFGRRNQDSGHS